MASKPLVALTATTATSDGIVRVRTNAAYVRALESAGLVPLITPPLDPAHAGRALDAVSGVVLTGGEDVAPHRYGEQPHPALGTVNEDRDAWEIALISSARERRIPTLAICRGIQVLNVALGGSLIQDIPSQCSAALPHASKDGRSARVHEVSVDPRSRLAGILDATTLKVNSVHHQSIARAADGLRITARAPDGIVEGAESAADDWWVVGVQWHPEELIDTPESWDRSLFGEFARQCGKQPRAESLPLRTAAYTRQAGR